MCSATGTRSQTAHCKIQHAAQSPGYGPNTCSWVAHGIPSSSGIREAHLFALRTGQMEPSSTPCSHGRKDDAVPDTRIKNIPKPVPGCRLPAVEPPRQLCTVLSDAEMRMVDGCCDLVCCYCSSCSSCSSCSRVTSSEPTPLPVPLAWLHDPPHKETNRDHFNRLLEQHTFSYPPTQLQTRTRHAPNLL